MTYMMILRKLSIAAICCAAAVAGHAQDVATKSAPAAKSSPTTKSTATAPASADKESYYRPPMDIRLLPSANFAETRPGHLHAGVDIRTGGVEGQKLYSAADGYISRIGVSPWGYGRVLYIAHPNGTTTVYGHMQRFTPEIERYVESERYRLRIHSGNLFPDASKFPVKRGQLIGYSGNSGSSGGPHLHFEVRETASQRPVNVLARGYLDIKDDIPPRIVNLYYIESDTVGIVPVYAKPRLLGVTNTAPGKYVLNGTETVDVGPRGYFVIEVTDRKNDSHNTMGIYSIDLSLGGESIFSYKLDGFLFDQQRYVNSLMQYDMQVGQRNQFLRLARQGNNKLPVFGKVVRSGLIMPADTGRYPVVITVADDAGNVSKLSFNVRRRSADRQFYTANDVEGTPVDCRRDFVLKRPDVEVTIPAGALYESIFYRQSCTDSIHAGQGNMRTIPRFSPVYNLHDQNVPIHTSITLSIAPDRDIPASIVPRLCLASVSDNGERCTSAGGKYAGGRVTGTLRAFGRYCVVADTIPPVVKPSFAKGADLRGSKSIYFVCTDDFSGVASYTATIDGQWIAFEAGKTRITHTFDPARIEYTGGRHELVLTVTDVVGNVKTLKTEFIK